MNIKTFFETYKNCPICNSKLEQFLSGNHFKYNGDYIENHYVKINLKTNKIERSIFFKVSSICYEGFSCHFKTIAYPRIEVDFIQDFIPEEDVEIISDYSIYIRSENDISYISALGLQFNQTRINFYDFDINKLKNRIKKLSLIS